MKTSVNSSVLIEDGSNSKWAIGGTALRWLLIEISNISH